MIIWLECEYNTCTQRNQFYRVEKSGQLELVKYDTITVFSVEKKNYWTITDIEL